MTLPLAPAESVAWIPIVLTPSRKNDASLPELTIWTTNRPNVSVVPVPMTIPVASSMIEIVTVLPKLEISLTPSM